MPRVVVSLLIVLCLASLSVPVACLLQGSTAKIVEEDAVVPVAALPADVADDAFPMLPPVAQILVGASRTLRSVSSKASGIVGSMKSAQKHSEAELDRHRQAFDSKLKTQEEQNRAVAKSSQKIVADIELLKHGSSELRKKAHAIQKQNMVLRSGVHSIESKLELGKQFAHKSIAETDDSKQSVLTVLLTGKRGPDDDFLNDDRPAVPNDDEDDDDELLNRDTTSKNVSQDSLKTSSEAAVSEDDADDDAKADGTSLLAISATVHRVSAQRRVSAVESFDIDSELSEQSSPESILKTLSRDVAKLVQERKQSTVNLQKLFMKDYRAGVKRYKALLSQKTLLHTQKAAQTAVQAKLKHAVQHLEDTHSQLGRRMHALGKFIQKLTHVANAPEIEVPQLIQNLPAAVSLPSK